jgi:hypothetical protein
VSIDRNTLMKTAMLLCVGVAALAVGNAADGKVSGPTAAVLFKLEEKHGSGVSGTATVTAAKKGVRVVLRLRGPLTDGLPAHIHTGPCRREPTFSNPRIWNSLLTVENGKSVTAVTTTTLKRLRAAPFSINVHHPKTLGAIACGDIPRANRS